MLIYHYCSIATMESILRSKNFWLANLMKSNDENEVKETFIPLWNRLKPRILAEPIKDVELIVKAWDVNFDIQYRVSPPFGTCFSLEGDLLSQWNEYGDNKTGVSLGFDPSWFTAISKGVPIENRLLENSIGLSKVMYHDKELEDKMFNLALEIIKMTEGNRHFILGILNFKARSAFIKNNFFKDERECRIVYYPDKSHDYEKNIIGLSALQTKPFDHYCLPWYKSLEDSALKMVILGPQCAISEDDIARTLKVNDINSTVEIVKSVAPYRKSSNSGVIL